MSRALLRVLGRIFPKLGQTECRALEAGTIGWDAELFSGAPNWQGLLETPVRALSADEQAFLDGDLPQEIWSFLREQRLFAMTIPKAWSGLGFSAAAHSAVVVKLSSRSVACAVTVMVPNSLGPAELLLHCGSDEQRRNYLPRLARAPGDELEAQARSIGLLSERELELLRGADRARDEVIQVDSFAPEVFPRSR